jgi:hypothetical protein
MSVEQASEAIGYRAATPLAAGLAHTVDWLRSTGRVAAWLDEEAGEEMIQWAPHRIPRSEKSVHTRAA